MQTVWLGSDDEVLRRWTPSTEKEFTPEGDASDSVAFAAVCDGLAADEAAKKKASEQAAVETICEPQEDLEQQEEEAAEAMDEITMFLQGNRAAAVAKGDSEEVARVDRLIAEHQRMVQSMKQASENSEAVLE